MTNGFGQHITVEKSTSLQWVKVSSKRMKKPVTYGLVVQPVIYYTNYIVETKPVTCGLVVQPVIYYFNYTAETKPVTCGLVVNCVIYYTNYTAATPF